MMHQYLTSEKEISNYFDNVINSDEYLKKHTKIIANWIISELFAFLKKENIEIYKSPVNEINLGKLIKLIVKDKISGKIAKDVFEEMFNTLKSPEDIIKEKNLSQVTDAKILEKIINDISGKQ